MKNLEQTRREIDRIDEGLVKLFLERLAVSRDVAMAKLETGGPVSDPAREREILTRVSEAAGPENENAARLFFTTLFSISKARQRGILKGDSPLVREIKGSIAAHRRTCESFPVARVRRVLRYRGLLRAAGGDASRESADDHVLQLVREGLRGG